MKDGLAALLLVISRAAPRGSLRALREHHVPQRDHLLGRGAAVLRPRSDDEGESSPGRGSAPAPARSEAERVKAARAARGSRNYARAAGPR